MKVNIQNINCKVPAGIKRHLVKKLDKIGLKYNWVQEAKVYFKESGSDHEHEKVVEVLLLVAGTNIYAKSQEETFGLAMKHALEAIRRQLEARKEKSFMSLLTHTLKN